MDKGHPTTWILVCDGARARIFLNTGPGTGLLTVTSAEHAESHRPTRDLGADRPGRSFDSSRLGGRHSMAPRADWHEFEKERFAHDMADVVGKAARDGTFDRLILVAPPRVLGDLRGALDDHAKARVAGELAKDLTYMSDSEIAGHLSELVEL